MPSWVDAEPKHRTFIQAFKCAPKLTPRYGDRTHRHQKDDWAHRFERWIHKQVQPPAVPPSQILIHLNEDEDRIDALVWFEPRVEPDEPSTVYVQIGALAVHLAAQGNGHGAAALDLVERRALLWALGRSVSVTRMTLAAEVHLKNDACIALISRRGWQQVTVEPSADGYHQWAAAYAIDPS